jgi:dihydroflavonol-4-reductase
MKVAVTGATGHLGANLVRLLLEKGYDVRAITKEPLDEGPVALRYLDVDRVHADVRDTAAMHRAIAGADVVYHLAARISIVDWDADVVRAVNVGGTSNVVDACLANDVRRLVHVSSPHARSQALGEQQVEAAVERGLDAVIVNPTGMIGPLDFKPSTLGRLLMDIWHGRLPELVAGGVNAVDVRDVATTLVSAEEKAARGARYVVTGRWLGIHELVELACKLIGRRPPHLVGPTWFSRTMAPLATTVSRVTGRPPRFVEQAMIGLEEHGCPLDIRATDELGHRPRLFERTLVDTYEWFSEQSGAMSGRFPALIAS